MFLKYRAKERSWNPLWWLFSYMFDQRYETLILGAYMMHVGAKINPEDLQHLNDVLTKVPCGNAYALPISDGGFRGPGRVQYKAALEIYVDGHPRIFLKTGKSAFKSTASTLTLPAASIVARPPTTLLRLNSDFVSGARKKTRQLLTATRSARRRTGTNIRPFVEDHRQICLLS